MNRCTAAVGLLVAGLAPANSAVVGQARLVIIVDVPRDLPSDVAYPATVTQLLAGAARSTPLGYVLTEQGLTPYPTSGLASVAASRFDRPRPVVSLTETEAAELFRGNQALRDEIV